MRCPQRRRCEPIDSGHIFHRFSAFNHQDDEAAPHNEIDQGFFCEAEPENEKRRDHEWRDRLQALDNTVEKEPDSREKHAQDRDRDARGTASKEADAYSLKRGPDIRQNRPPARAR